MTQSPGGNVAVEAIVEPVTQASDSDVVDLTDIHNPHG